LAEKVEARYCFGCGELNPKGLKLSFRLEEGRAVALFSPQPEHQGWPGVMHGGLVATLLDEAMGWALAALGIWAVTGKLEFRLRRPVPLDRPLQVSGWLLRDRGRALLARGEITTQEGELLAEAQGLFMRVPKGRERELRAIYGLEK